jgi:hypothetical protein
MQEREKQLLEQLQEYEKQKIEPVELEPSWYALQYKKREKEFNEMLGTIRMYTLDVSALEELIESVGFEISRENIKRFPNCIIEGVTFKNYKSVINAIIEWSELPNCTAKSLYDFATLNEFTEYAELADHFIKNAKYYSENKPHVIRKVSALFNAGLYSAFDIQYEQARQQ